MTERLCRRVLQRAFLLVSATSIIVATLADGKVLFVKISELVGLDTTLIIDEKSLQAINLDTGKVNLIAKVRGPFGMDWRSDNAKSAVATKI